MRQKFYGKGIPGVGSAELKGKLIVLEGPDGAGRSTQMALLADRLQRLGYPTTSVGLKRSTLAGTELESAMQGNTLGPRTLSLFYATDFVDQLEHGIIPALRAGFVVLADRYIFTLMARDVARGGNPHWLAEVYEVALVPDLILYLRVSPKVLAERALRKRGELNYWESGMDIERSGDMYQCFLRYQQRIQQEFQRMSKQYDFQPVYGNRAPLDVHHEIFKHVAPVVGASLEKTRRRPIASRELS